MLSFIALTIVFGVLGGIFFNIACEQQTEGTLRGVGPLIAGVICLLFAILCGCAAYAVSPRAMNNSIGSATNPLPPAQLLMDQYTILGDPKPIDCSGVCIAHTKRDGKTIDLLLSSELGVHKGDVVQIGKLNHLQTLDGADAYIVYRVVGRLNAEKPEK